MSKAPFSAKSWLKTARNSSTRPIAGPSLAQRSSALESQDGQVALFQGVPRKFSPSNFLIPGWTGEGLISRHAVDLRNSLIKLVSYARANFYKNSWNKTQIKNIRQEFYSFTSFPYGPAGEMWIDCHEEFKDESQFWSLFSASEEKLREQNENYPEVINEFINFYCFRAVTIYLFKIRFITILCEKSSEYNLSINTLLNPNSFLNKVFRKGSSYELGLECLQVNEYSWFSPPGHLKEDVLKISASIIEVTTTEIMKIFSTEAPKIKPSPYFECKDHEYSHSLSHKYFGQFLNTLFLYFPLWLEGKSSTTTANAKHPKIVNTHFAGDHMTAISLSHWLAQESALGENWEEVLCPDFHSFKNKNEKFIKYCHELQLLFFLVKLSLKFNRPTVQFIAQTIRERNAKTKYQSSFCQLSMFDQIQVNAQSLRLEKQSCKDILYERVFLNLTRLPRKNPHHYVTQKLLSFEDRLVNKGIIFLSSNQKLFVPSQSERVKQIQEKFIIIAQISFEDLKGKGEIANYLYILTKRDNSSLLRPSLSNVSDWNNSLHFAEKETCYSFKLNGHLNMFHKFSDIVNSFKFFFESRPIHKTPIFQTEVNHDITLEYFQDALFDGKLLSSTSKDSSHITHPNFFKKLTQSSVYLDTFFQIESIEDNLQKERKKGLTLNLLGHLGPDEKKYPFVIIVNLSDLNHIKLEIINYSSYLARKEKYGRAFYHYFGLTPKAPEINSNLFREYFQSPIGTQIIQLCLNGGPTKIKSKLQTLLVPKFFADFKLLPPSCEQKLNILGLDFKSLLAMDPNKIEAEWNTTLESVNNLKDQYTWYIASKLCYAKSQFESAIEIIGDPKISFESKLKNKIVIQELLKLKSINIFPHHPDIFIEFVTHEKSDLGHVIENIRFAENIEEGDGQLCLEIYSKNKKLVMLHGPRYLIRFVAFITSPIIAQEVTISDFIYSLQIPIQDDFQNVLKKTSAIQNTFNDIKFNIGQLIDNIFISKISLS